MSPEPMFIPSSDGVRIALWDLGGPGPPLLCAHATGFCGGVWEPLARHVTDWSPRAVDFRAHGSAVTPMDVRVDWEAYADDVLAAVDHMGGGPIAAIGHSMGGAALVLAELRQPGTFRALWMYEPVIFPRPDPPGDTVNPMAAGARRRRNRFPSAAAARQNFATKPPLDVLAPEALDAYIRYGFAPQADGSVELRCRPEDEARTFAMGTHHTAWDRLPEVGCPVTIATGTKDMGPADIASEIASALPHGRLEVHRELGHFGPLEDPARLALAATAALAEPAARDGGSTAGC